MTALACGAGAIRQHLAEGGAERHPLALAVSRDWIASFKQKWLHIDLIARKAKAS